MRGKITAQPRYSKLQPHLNYRTITMTHVRGSLLLSVDEVKSSIGQTFALHIEQPTENQLRRLMKLINGLPCDVVPFEGGLQVKYYLEEAYQPQ